MANVVELADFLFANMDESGTNNDEIIHRLSVLTSEQRNILKHTFQEKYSEDLAEKLQKEFSEDELGEKSTSTFYLIKQSIYKLRKFINAIAFCI